MTNTPRNTLTVSALLAGLCPLVGNGIYVGPTGTGETRWWPAVAGALGVLAAWVGIAAPESYVPIPSLLLLVWMIVLGVATMVRGPARPGCSQASRPKTARNHVSSVLTKLGVSSRAAAVARARDAGLGSAG